VKTCRQKVCEGPAHPIESAHLRLARSKLEKPVYIDWLIATVVWSRPLVGLALNPEIVERAGDALCPLLEDVGIDHGRLQIVVPEQLLDGADVGAALEQVSRKGMAEGVGGDVLRQARLAHGRFDGLVDHARVDMVTPRDS